MISSDRSSILAAWTECRFKKTQMFTFNPIQDGHFWGCSQIGGGPPSFLKSVADILQWWNLTDPKNIWITWHTPWVLLTSAFFHRKSANFVISRNTDIDCILVHNSFSFSWVFKDFFNKPGYNFDDISKNGYPRPS